LGRKKRKRRGRAIFVNAATCPTEKKGRRVEDLRGVGSGRRNRRVRATGARDGGGFLKSRVV